MPWAQDLCPLWASTTDVHVRQQYRENGLQNPIRSADDTKFLWYLMERMWNGRPEPRPTLASIRAIMKDILLLFAIKVDDVNLAKQK